MVIVVDYDIAAFQELSDEKGVWILPSRTNV